MRVFITGGTGLIGIRLIRHLRLRDDQVVVLSRGPDAAQRVGTDCEVVRGDPVQPGDWQERAAQCDAIVNLAGENLVGGRWTESFKTALRDSRIKSTENCAQAIARDPKRGDGSPKVFVSGSAIGIYGPHGDEPVDESTPPGDDFLARLCVDWEKATALAAEAGVRVVLARTGVVLDKQGGALKKMLLPFKMGVGGPVGSGKQYMPWIHHADETGLLAFALDTSAAHGPMNLTAPNPVTNKEFGKALGRALGRPAFMWTPGFALKLLMGEGAEVVLTGAKVLPKKALELGYQFRYSQIDAALADVLKG
jgi:uncharacterized protein (TIGR01777 family)